MLLITAALAIGFAISLPICLTVKSHIAEVITITIGITLYHFVMRLAVGTALDFIMKNKANYKNWWFREKRFECKLYKLIRVHKWKKYIPTYDPNTFDAKRKTVEELVGATCQAEVIHEIIMVLSLLPIASIPLLGGAEAMIITSVLSMMFDSLFVILQRYNRPKLVRVMNRQLHRSA